MDELATRFLTVDLDSDKMSQKDQIICVIYRVIPKNHLPWDEVVQKNRLFIIEAQRMIMTSIGIHKNITYKIHIVYSDKGNYIDIEELIYNEKDELLKRRIVEMPLETALYLGCNNRIKMLHDEPYNFDYAIQSVKNIATALDEWAFNHSVFKKVKDAKIIQI